MSDQTPHDPRFDETAAPAWPADQHPGGGAPRNGLGLTALVLGIVGLVLAVLFFPLGILLGIAAVVLGVLGRKRAARREATNGGQATAGIVTGVIAVVLGGLIAAFVGSFLADNAEEISDLTECIEQAAGDDAAEQACQQRFEDQVVGQDGSG